jgi:CubicO group peptidase (beta-lactamase class C family)
MSTPGPGIGSVRPWRAGRFLAGVVMTMAAGAAAPAEPARDLEELQRRIGAVLERERVPGAGIALSGHDGLLWSGGVGVAGGRAGGSVTAGTAFRAGSVSKSVTALAVMRLVEQGRLSLEARLHGLAPEVPFENPWEEERPVRLAHLLEHTAGFEFCRFNEWFDDRGEPRSLLDALAVNPASRRSRWPPGTRMSYSNEGYLAAGYVLEKVTGRSFDDAVRELVFEPVGMTDSAFRLTPEVGARLAQGFGPAGRPVRYEEDMIRPAANLIVSPRDMAQYLRLWLGRGEVGGRQLLSRSGVSRIESRRTLPYDGPEDQYGLGNGLCQRDGHVGRGHSGWTFGFSASFCYLPREGVGWAVLLNRQSARGALAAIESEMLAFLVRGEEPPAAAPVPVDREVLGRLAGFYRDVTPGEQFAAPLVALGGLHVAEHEGALAVRDDAIGSVRSLVARRPWVRLLPAGRGAFRREGEAASTMLFVRTPEGTDAVVTGGGYLERSPASAVSLARAFAAGAILCMLSALAFTPVWLLAWLRSGQAPPHSMVRLLPALASLCALALWAIVTRSPQLWGRLNATSASICALTWAFAAFSLLALVASVAAPAREVGVFVKLHSVLVSVACAGLTAFAWNAKWIGVRTWRW